MIFKFCLWLQPNESKNSNKKSDSSKNLQERGGLQETNPSESFVGLLQALVVFKQIASHFDLSVKSLKRWIKRYESDGLENLSDRDRKGRPCQLTDEQKELLKAALEDDKQRVWSRGILQCCCRRCLG